MKIESQVAEKLITAHNFRVSTETEAELAQAVTFIASRAAATFPEMVCHDAPMGDYSRTVFEDRHCYVGYTQISATSFDFWLKSRADECDASDEVGQDACDNFCDAVQDEFYAIASTETA
jgi:hypothetical protein